jgi:hypothetical protein
VSDYTPSVAAREASDYFNSLPAEERQKLAPLLEHYRQMGLAEMNDGLRQLQRRTDARIKTLRAYDWQRFARDAIESA